ncbi:AAA family ATPase [Alteromonas facilis]|uniref:AAA family ATPase n=1 Tax=Alteromonas facilis TaxID=2048004 RepID=UPI000C284DD1|nr:AAA family ATPase [Alteromonas facilis]
MNESSIDDDWAEIDALLDSLDKLGNEEVQQVHPAASTNRLNYHHEITQTPFDKLIGYSITGRSSELQQQLLDDRFVLDGIAILGQWTTIYASPNTGKTLLTIWLLRQAVQAGEVDGEKVFYVNADDNFRGLVEKVQLFEKVGVHMLAPHQNGFDTQRLVGLLSELATNGQASGTVIILDTLKKFTDLMNKQEASNFGATARAFVSNGGTLIALAHTNKHKNAEGKSVYSGTSDIRDDSDCVFIIEKLSAPDDALQTVEFQNSKARGDVEDKVGFTYRKQKGQAYVELLNSVQRVDADIFEEQKDQLAEQQKLFNDAPLINCIRKLIDEGVNSKSLIVKRANELSGASTRVVRNVLEERTGNLWILGHRWKKEAREHNKYVYTCIEQDDTNYQGLHPE